MDEGKAAFSLIITDNAKEAFYELLGYFKQHYSIDRVFELTEDLLDTPLVLIENPYLGSLELGLEEREPDYRFLLFKRSNRATVKIVYYVDDSQETIYITDFFPTEMRPENVGKKR